MKLGQLIPQFHQILRIGGPATPILVLNLFFYTYCRIYIIFNKGIIKILFLNLENNIQPTAT